MLKKITHMVKLIIVIYNISKIFRNKSNVYVATEILYKRNAMKENKMHNKIAHIFFISLVGVIHRILNACNGKMQNAYI